MYNVKSALAILGFASLSGCAPQANGGGTDGGGTITALLATTTEVACDRVNTVVAKSSATSSTTTRNYFAELAVPGLRPETAPLVRVTVCDLRGFGDAAPTLGDPGTGYVPPSDYCSNFAGARVSNDLVVVQCGFELEITSTAGTSKSGSHWLKAFVNVTP